MKVMSFQWEKESSEIPAGDALLLGKRISVRSLSCPAGATAWREKLEGFEFLWPLEGEIRLARGQRILVGDLALFAPGAEMVFTATERGVSAIVVEFEICAYPHVWGEITRWARVVHLRNGDICGALLSYLNTHASRGDESVLSAALVALLRAYVTGQTTYNRPAVRVLSPQVKAALEEIRRRLAKRPFAPISVGQIAKKVGLSCMALNRHFRRCVGNTPIAEVYLARLDRAVELLARTDLPMSVVAAMTGFSNDSHLAKYTRAQFAMNSSALRRALQSGSMPHPAPQSPLLMTTPMSLLPPRREALPESARRKFARRYRRQRRHEMILERMGRILQKRKVGVNAH